MRVHKMLAIMCTGLLMLICLGAMGKPEKEREEVKDPAVPVMALLEETPPLVQTPVSKEIDLNDESAGFTVQIIKKPDAGIKKGKILIYHTHTYEAYRQDPDAPYKETEKWRTKDDKHNVVRVGEELAALLRAKGFEVVHDRVAYEPPNLSSSYTRSLNMLEKRESAGETYDLYIDLHRDAYVQGAQEKNTVSIWDREHARLMMLIGKGSGQSYQEKPEWEKNLLIAEYLTEALNQQISGLCRRISIKTGRFNQHVAPRCILIEAGNNENTLEEVLNSMPYLADALAAYLNDALTQE